MSSETEPDVGSETEETHSRIEALEAHLSSDAAQVSERLTRIRARLTDYENAESTRKRQDALDEVESELQEVRTAIEREVEAGKDEAHDIVDRIETNLSNLR